jgi:hypothetical protein
MSVIVRTPSGQLRLYCKGAVSISKASPMAKGPWRYFVCVLLLLTAVLSSTVAQG